MSSVLGPVHSWLFGKIKFQDELTESILDWAEQNGFNELNYKVDKKCGKIPEGKLEDIIDLNNIHGWLQECVGIVESRLALTVTSILNKSVEYIEPINNIAYDFGKIHCSPDDMEVKEAYTYLDYYLLNGMPCDGVNRIISETSDRLAWELTKDIHKSYWDNVGGKVKNYYDIRVNIVIGIFEDSDISFIQIDDHTFELRKEE